MKAQRAQKILLATLVVMAALLLTGLWFATKYLSAQSLKLSTLKAEADAPASQYETLQKTKTQLAQLGDVSNLLKKTLPETANQSMIISELNSIAANNRITITKIQFDETPVNAKKVTKNKISGVRLVPVTIDTGKLSYVAMINFLKQVEQNRWLMQPTNIIIQPTEGGRTINGLSFSLNLYVRQDK